MLAKYAGTIRCARRFQNAIAGTRSRYAGSHANGHIKQNPLNTKNKLTPTYPTAGIALNKSVVPPNLTLNAGAPLNAHACVTSTINAAAAREPVDVS